MIGCGSSVEALLVGDVVAHRVALDDVAVVDEDRVAGFGADGLDDRGGAGEAQRVVGRVGEIVVGEDGDVEVGGLHEAQVRLAGLRHHGIGVEDDGGAGGGGAGEEGAAGNGRVEFHDDCSLRDARCAWPRRGKQYGAARGEWRYLCRAEVTLR